MRPDFRNFRGVCLFALIHSAKGSTWEKHKYIKRIDGTYYYPDSYEGGRHLPDGEKKDGFSGDDNILSKLEDLTGMKREGLSNLLKLYRENGADSKEFKDLLKILSEGDEDQAKKMTDLMGSGNSSSSGSLSSNDVETLAMEVIRDNFGNGQIRKDLLGEYYSQVQTRVNEIMRGSTGTTKMEAVSEAVSEVGEQAVKKAVSSAAATGPGLDYETIFGVYRKK